jgi:plasmid maintenance system antidote protein VapI
MTKLTLLKGIHPGLFLQRELKRRAIPMGRLALTIGEYPQTLNAIAHGKRAMNTPLAMRIENELGLEEGFLMSLQIFFDIKQEKQKQTAHLKPDTSIIRPVTFWDTDLAKIDWIGQRKAIIERVAQRGNEKEKNEIARFYRENTFSTSPKGQKKKSD